MANGRFDNMRIRPATVSTVASNPEALVALFSRVLGEFREMPGTSLTLAEACRLFGVAPDVAACILHRLVEDGVLRVTRDGRYRLRAPAA